MTGGGGRCTHGAVRIWLVRLLVLLAASMAAAPTVAEAATFSVTKTTDTVPLTGTGTPASCSLRQAIEAANKGSGDVVTVPAGAYAISEGELTVAKPMMIEGVGPATTTVDAGGLSRVLNVPPPPTRQHLRPNHPQREVAGSNVVLGQGAGIQKPESYPAQRRDQRQHRAARWRNRGDRERRRHLQLRRTVDLRERDRRQPGHHPATQRRHCLRRRHLQPRVPADGGLSLLRNTASAAAIPTGGAVYAIGPTANGGIAEFTRVRFEGNKALNNTTGGFAERRNLVLPDQPHCPAKARLSRTPR